MACPIPIRIINPHYRKIAEQLQEPIDNYSDRFDFYIDVPCGRCVNCRRSYKNSWRIRLLHEYQYLSPSDRNNCYFVTLTFNDDYLPSSKEEAAKLIRKFLERVRKKYKVSVRHWFVSEFGSRTERLHFHGILFNPPFPEWELPTLWNYGFTDSKLLNARRINYVTTYINKLLSSDIEEPDKRQWIFCSPGLGKAYTLDPKVRLFSHHDGIPSPFGYINGSPFALPRYYRHYLFDDDEREDLAMKYFNNYSEDVIPDPPYYIGTRRFDDYTLYLAAAAALRAKFQTLYYKPKNYGFTSK